MPFALPAALGVALGTQLSSAALPLPPRSSEVELGPAPAPLDDPPSHARRLFEFVPEFSVGVPECAAREGPGCATLSAGTELGLLVLARPNPFVGVGAAARFANFAIGQTTGFDRARASASFFGVVGRVYAFESGILDPFLELDLGVSSLDVELADAIHRGEVARLAPAMRSALGIDFALNSWLRLGTFVAFSRAKPSSASRCTLAGCEVVPADSTSLALGALSLGAGVTAALGELL